MKPITTRTEIRWALEDAGERGKLLLEYLERVFEYADSLAVTAKITAEELKSLAKFCSDAYEVTRDEDWDETRYKLETCASNLDYTMEEYFKC